MSKTFDARRLDVAAFAQSGASLAGRESLYFYERLAQESQGETADSMPDPPWVDWQSTGGFRRAADGSLRPSIHLRAHVGLPLTCQRCLGQVQTQVDIDRHVVFVDDEDSAAALDDESDDDVLAIVPGFDLYGLIEDELLLALPLVPRHEACADGVQLSAQSADFDTALHDKPQPFAALAALRKGDQGR